MAEATVSHSTSGSTVVTEPPPETERPPSVVLKLHKPKSEKAVKWEEGTVDNEFMNKKKSKCCCVYEKPRMFGESSSEDEGDDDCSHCRGHKKKDFRQPPDGAAEGNEPSSQPPDS